MTNVKVDFWPDYGEHGEPDVLLTLDDSHCETLMTVLVEAKLHSPKGGAAADDEDELAEDSDLADDDLELVDEDLPDPDQLVRCWQALRERVKSKGQIRLIYLTKHGAPPAQELAESVGRAREKGFEMELGWLSWRDVWAVVEKAARTELAAADLSRLLAHKGLKHFTGFRGEPWRRPDSGRLWRGTRWFRSDHNWSAPPGVAHFWQ